MARPNKPRSVCSIPACTVFIPAHNCKNEIELILTIEEYEVIRLIDYLNMSQQEAANHIGVSRATIQGIYSEARTKLSRFIVEGTHLRIHGGNYTICQRSYNCDKLNWKEGKRDMKIAVTYENGQVFQHFGHTEQFKVYDIKDGKIASSTIVDTNGEGHGALANFLFNSNISVLICGGIGGGARNALAEAGIELYPGATGDADAQVESFLQGKLQYNPETVCNHHAHEEGHTCGEHGCGSHN